jgi:hypothetical protein
MLLGDVSKCAKLVVSLGSTAFCTFCITFGSAGLAHLSQDHSWLSLLWALFEASLASGTVVAFAWKRSPLAKDLKLSLPSKFDTLEHDMLKDGITTLEGPR